MGGIDKFVIRLFWRNIGCAPLLRLGKSFGRFSPLLRQVINPMRNAEKPAMVLVQNFAALAQTQPWVYLCDATIDMIVL